MADSRQQPRHSDWNSQDLLDGGCIALSICCNCRASSASCAWVTDWTLDLIFPPDIVKVDIDRDHGTSRRHYEAGEYIYQSGDIATEFYIVLAGEVEVLREGEGRESQVATLKVGEYFGEMSLLRDIPRSSSVRASTRVELLIMTGEDFLALASSSSLFGDLLQSVVQERNTINMANESRETSPR